MLWWRLSTGVLDFSVKGVESARQRLRFCVYYVIISQRKLITNLCGDNHMYQCSVDRYNVSGLHYIVFVGAGAYVSPEG